MQPRTPLEARLRLAHSGHSPIPTNGKIPHARGWQSWHHREDEVIRLWDRGYPDHHNTSVLTRDTPFLDIDIRNPEAAEAAELFVKDRFDGHYIMTRVGAWPKRAIPFRTDAPFDKIVITLIDAGGGTHKLEFLASGQQIVVHGEHPDTHRPYEWHGPFFETARDDLPGIDATSAKDLIEALADMLCREHGFTRPGDGPKNGGGNHGPSDQEDLLEAIIRGTALHDPLIILAAKRAKVGIQRIGIIKELREAMLASQARAARPDDWQERFNDIPRYVDSAINKYAPTPTPTPTPTPIPPVQWYAELKGETFMPLQWIVPDYIPEGVSLLAGKPKIGKSWLALAITMACAEGAIVLDQRCAQRGVIYFALEDTKRRMQSRTDKMLGTGLDWPANAGAVYELPMMDKGCIERLQHYAGAHPNVGLMIIDTLAKIRGPKRKDEDQYAADHRTMSALLDFSHQTGIAIVVIHHVRKQTAEDVFDTISGTLGLNGGADTLVVLTKTKDSQLRLAVRGRDLEEQDKLVFFDIEMGAWGVTGDYEPEEDVALGTKSLIISALTAAGTSGMSPADIAKKTALPDTAVRQQLSRMTRAGKIKKTQYGTYVV